MIKHYFILTFLFVLMGCNNNSRKVEYLYNTALSTSTVYPNSTNNDSLRYSLQLLDEAIAIDSTDSKLYSLKCNIYLLLEDKESAFNAAQMGWDKTKEDYTLALFTGAMLESKNESEDAKEYYAAALKKVNQLDTTDIYICLERTLILMLLDKPFEVSTIKSKINERQDSMLLNEVFNRIFEANKKDSLAHLIIGAN